MKIIKDLYGYSSNKLEIIDDNGFIFVRKYGDNQRNLERLLVLKNLDLPTPKILHCTNEYYDMEFIQGMDIKNYLLNHSSEGLASFLVSLLDTFKKYTKEKCYIDVYNKKLYNVDFSDLSFNKQQLIEKLPKVLPSSLYHGDLTLDNILYDIKNNRFVLIDPLTTDYDSYVFDVSKLKQDLICKWFIRDTDLILDSKLKHIDDLISDNFSYNYLVILMLLRIYPYVKTKKDYIFLTNEINKLWKL